MLSSTLLGWLSGDQNMMAMMAHNWLLGVFIVACIVFVETGVVILPFLPGDSLLFATGTFLGINHIWPGWAIALISLAAILGDGLNYLIGRSLVGQQLIRKGWIRPQHLERTRAYFDRFGPTTITIGRFVPIVRTVAPFLAGLSGMRSRTFVLYNLIGALVWCPLILLAGFWLGNIAWIREHLSWVSLAIVAISVLPILVQIRQGALSKGA
jgi:membrane-associated protein